MRSGHVLAHRSSSIQPTAVLAMVFCAVFGGATALREMASDLLFRSIAATPAQSSTEFVDTLWRDPNDAERPAVAATWHAEGRT